MAADSKRHGAGGVEIGKKTEIIVEQGYRVQKRAQAIESESGRQYLESGAK